MSYVSQTLAKGERILKSATFNWTYSVSSFLWGVFSILPISYLMFLIATGQDIPGQLPWVMGLSAVPAVLGLFLLIAHLIHLNTTEIVVTTFRFVYKTGLISRDTKEVSLNKIEEISLRQSILGRIFGYGNMTLRGTGVGVITLPNVDRPLKVRQIIESAKAKLRGPTAQNLKDAAPQAAVVIPMEELR
ncbi:MAG: PH domain-containing protein [Pseudomonadota bacterium]